MAKSNQGSSSGEARTEPMDVGPDQSAGLAAAFDGVYHLFGGRVKTWHVTPEGLVAEGFTVLSDYNPEQILTDINRQVRRAPLMPPLMWINGVAPEHFETPQAITTYLTQYFKEEGSSRSAEYARTAAAKYKAQFGDKFPARGRPKAGIVSALKNITSLNEDALVAAGLTREDADRLLEIAKSLSGTTPNQAPNEPVATNA